MWRYVLHSLYRCKTNGKINIQRAYSFNGLGTAAKDDAIREWCECVSEASGADWRYMRVNQTGFDSARANTLGNLIDELACSA